MANSGTHAERVADKLVEYLFNQKVLSLPQVSPAKIAEVAGDAAPVFKDGKLEYKRHFSRITIWRWLKALGLDEKSAEEGLEPATPEQISAFLIGNLSFEQAEKLYDWARAERFDQQKPAKRTTAKGRAKRQTRAKAAEDAAAKAKQAQKALAQGKSAPKRTFPEVFTSLGPTGKILNKAEVGTHGLARAVEKGIITKEERRELVWKLAEGEPLTGLSEGAKYGYDVLTADTHYFNTAKEPRHWAYRQVLGYLTEDQRAKLEQAKAGHESGDKALDAIAKTYNELVKEG